MEEQILPEPSPPEPQHSQSTKQKILKTLISSLIFLLLTTGLVTGILIRVNTYSKSNSQLMGGDVPYAANLGTSQQHFTNDNYGDLVANPDAFRDSTVDVEGRVFTAPQTDYSTGIIYLQMYVDMNNDGWNTVVTFRDPKNNTLNINKGDVIQVRGTVIGQFTGHNVLGNQVSTVKITAESIIISDNSLPDSPVTSV